MGDSRSDDGQAVGRAVRCACRRRGCEGEGTWYLAARATPLVGCFTCRPEKWSRTARLSMVMGGPSAISTAKRRRAPLKSGDMVKRRHGQQNSF